VQRIEGEPPRARGFSGNPEFRQDGLKCGDENADGSAIFMPVKASEALVI